MAQQGEARRPATVGIAIETPALRRSVTIAIAESKRYEALAFDSADVTEGTWPAGTYAGVVATPRSFHLCRVQHNGVLGTYPVVLVVGEEDLFRNRATLAACDAFVLAERVHSLLPSIIVISAFRFSAIPWAAGRLQIDRRLLMLPQLSGRDRAVLAELARGSDNADIAARLDISESTAKVCVRRVVGLFGFRNRTDAAVFAAAFDLGNINEPPTTFANGATK
jgi:DNA-binding CsgD family transcriptional regulator